VLVGASTTIPKIQELLTSIFGKSPSVGVDAVDVVTKGACIVGAHYGLQPFLDGLSGRAGPSDHWGKSAIAANADFLTKMQIIDDVMPLTAPPPASRVTSKAPPSVGPPDKEEENANLKKELRTSQQEIARLTAENAILSARDPMRRGVPSRPIALVPFPLNGTGKRTIGILAYLAESFGKGNIRNCANVTIQMDGFDGDPSWICDGLTDTSVKSQSLESSITVRFKGPRISPTDIFLAFPRDFPNMPKGVQFSCGDSKTINRLLFSGKHWKNSPKQRERSFPIRWIATQPVVSQIFISFLAWKSKENFQTVIPFELSALEVYGCLSPD
jgi:hypothetical protein